MAMSRVCSSRVPLIIILGSTGTGKTKLSIELALKYKTEIISADSMQIYKGLDIVSAKATPEERATVPHHAIDILQPHQTFTVLDFRNKALPVIDEMMANDKIPLIVGGTTYYIEAILWKILIEDMSSSDKNLLTHERDEARNKHKRHKIETPGTSDKMADLQDGDKPVESGARDDHGDTKETCPDDCVDDEDDFSDNSKLSSEYLIQKLKEVDPEMAARLHPNNRRKILRSLQVWAETGRTHSDVLKDQRSEEGGCGLGGPLRYPNAIIFWLYCQQDILDARLDKRVDTMMEDGLVDELTDFHDKYNKQRIIDGIPTDYTKGIFQSIGFKEFHEYLILNAEERKTVLGQRLFAESLENMKIATKRYSKRQNKIVKNRFLGHPTRKVPPVYKLDTSDVSEWNVNVYEKAVQILEHILNNTECPINPEPASTGQSYIGGIDPNSYHFCDICQRVFIGDHQYNIHIRSKRHRKQLKKAPKTEDKNPEDGCSSL